MNIHQDPRITGSASQAFAGQQHPDKASDLKKLRESARDFESMYIYEVYKSMRKNVPDNGLFKQSHATKLFQEMLDMEMARTAAEGEGIGIGEKMFEQLKDNVR